MINCVTTMNKDYYDVIGKIMIKTWCKYFPSDSKIYLYLEDFSLDFNDSRFVLMDWQKEISPLLDQWKTHWESFRENKSRSLKFTKKAFSQISAWNHIKHGKFLWLDADIVFLNSFDEKIFDKTIEHYPLASWGNGKFESGTVFINLDHNEWPKIKKTYEDIYSGKIKFPKGENLNTERFYPGNKRLIFPNGWLDGEILGYSCVSSDVEYKNLNYLCKNNRSNTPLNDSPLGTLMHHLKAKGKFKIKEALTRLKREDLLIFLNN